MPYDKLHMSENTIYKLYIILKLLFKVPIMYKRVTLTMQSIYILKNLTLQKSDQNTRAVFDPGRGIHC